MCLDMPNVDYFDFPRRRFGVEIEYGQLHQMECLALEIEHIDPKRQASVFHYYCHTSGDNGWHVKRDHSCGDVLGEYGMEVASPILKGWSDLLVLSNVCMAANRVGCMPNDRCGLHIHVDVSDYSISQLVRLMAWWIKTERFWFWMEQKERALSEHCMPFWTKCEIYKDLLEANDEFTFTTALLTRSIERKTSLSLWNIFQDRETCEDHYKPTVELRMPGSSPLAHDVVNWCRTFLRFVAKMKTSQFPTGLGDVATVKDFLIAIGLWGPEGRPAQLSPGLWQARHWVLRRLASHAADQDIVKQALDLICYCVP